MSKPKIIALYLPQFHCIPENDEFWGKGFTDWVTVKNAKPLFKGHNQPVVPLNENYYDLSIKENVEWQSSLAHKHGIYGFGVYHYWFNNEKNLLTKPAEIMRDDKEIPTKYFFIWDNCNWKRSWSNVSGNAWAPVAEQPKDKGQTILIPYILGTEEDWETHYQYVATHFKSDRYIKKDNKPIFCIFNYSKEINNMCRYWNILAQKDGFEGVHFIFHNPRINILPNKTYRYSYEPHSSGWHTHLTFWDRVVKKLHSFISVSQHSHSISFYEYDVLWEQLLLNARKHPETTFYHGAFVSYDDSPRRGDKGAIIVKGATPEKFQKYFSELVKISSEQNKEFIFLTAWNEWGEGAYLEPDVLNGIKYLEAVQNATIN